jgi:hypothetical protein
MPQLYDGWPQLVVPLSPGETRRVGFVFLSDDAADLIRKAGTFYLWEVGHCIGEAAVVPQDAV